MGGEGGHKRKQIQHIQTEKKAVIIGGGEPKYVPVRKFRDEVREAKKPALNIYGLAIYFYFSTFQYLPHQTKHNLREQRWLPAWL